MTLLREADMAIAERPVYCVLGLPFDALNLRQAADRLYDGVARQDRSILSTPNVNWIALARRDPAFRRSVQASACSVMDGMPLVWLARLAGLPFPERVSGSDLIERLRRADRPLRVFLFGGLGDVAERAAAVLATERGALVPVGARNPGKGSIEEMSTPQLIAEINSARPDLIIVSLGAQRGQAWITHNRSRLDAPWVTHLGAVVNFFAGEVRRSPPWMARLGLEWAWRIAEEPGLWRRYWDDGKTLFGLVLTRTLPLMLRQQLERMSAPVPASAQLLSSADNGLTLDLAGDWHETERATLSQHLASARLQSARITLNMRSVGVLSAGIIGQLLVVAESLRAQGGQLRVSALSKRAHQSIHGHCAEHLLENTL
jgi:N-acetylglucosaminyldiphosphoundecaprenol N-acetyl-beta-D-mannosaminyltransferase